MRRFEIVNGEEYSTARNLVEEARRAVLTEDSARRLRSGLVERVVEPIVRRDGRRAVHLEAVALDDQTLNLPYGRRPEGSVPIMLDLRTNKEDVLTTLRPKVAGTVGFFDKVRKRTN
jgi:hypothetical protein